MKLYFEAFKKQVDTMGETEVLDKQIEVQSKDEALALKLQYPDCSSYRFHQCAHGEEVPSPCFVEEI